MAGSTFTVTRSGLVHAPIDAVAAALANLRDWPSWSPWHDLDPNQTLTYGGPDSGVGATSAWKGNRKVGQGSMEITHADSDRVVVDLHFIKPFRADNVATFALSPAGDTSNSSPAGDTSNSSRAGDTTNVSWSMTGPRNLLMKLMGLIMNFDKRIGADFEKGLARLDSHLSPR